MSDVPQPNEPTNEDPGGTGEVSADEELSHEMLAILGYARHIEKGLPAARLAVDRYTSIAKDVLPHGEEVVQSLEALKELATAQLEVVLVGKSGCGRSTLLNAITGHKLVEGPNAAPVRALHSADLTTTSLSYSRVKWVRTYWVNQAITKDEFERYNLGDIKATGDAKELNPLVDGELLQISGPLLNSMSDEILDLVTVVDSQSGLYCSRTSKGGRPLTREADVVVLVLDASVFKSASEMALDEEALQCIAERTNGLFLVWNKCDGEGNVASLAEIQAKAKELAKLHSVDPAHVFCISAADASDGAYTDAGAEVELFWSAVQTYLLQEANRRATQVHQALQPHREVLDYWKFLKGSGSPMQKLVHSLLCTGYQGGAGLQSAAAMGESLIDCPLNALSRKADSMILTQTATTFTTGFVTGLGGFVTFPVAVPTALAAAYCVRFRLCLAMAYGGGYDLHAPATITAVLMCTYGGQPMQATHPEMPTMEMIQNPPEEEEGVGMLERIRQMAETGISDASGQQETELDEETEKFDEKANADTTAEEKAEKKEDDLEQIVAAGWSKSGPRRRALLTAHKAYKWWVEAHGGEEVSSQENGAALAQQAYLLALYREITLCVPMSVRSALNSTAYLAEVIPVVGGVVSGGTDGVLTTAAGRKAKACFLKERMEKVEALVASGDLEPEKTIGMKISEGAGNAAQNTREAFSRTGSAMREASASAGVKAAEANKAMAQQAAEAKEQLAAASVRAKEVASKASSAAGAWWGKATQWGQSTRWGSKLMGSANTESSVQDPSSAVDTSSTDVAVDVAMEDHTSQQV